MLIDDFSDTMLISKLGTQWRSVSDQVMGGISQGRIEREEINGCVSLHLTGNVRLDNNGGFVQATLDLDADEGEFDASEYSGLCLTVRGNHEQYSVHLRTGDCSRPWQSYRAQFHAGTDWDTIIIPFHDFMPYRIEVPLKISGLKRIGLVAIGRQFNADLEVSDISLYS